MSYKPITVKFDETLYKKINKHPLSNSELIRKGCTMFLQSGKKNQGPDGVILGNTQSNTKGNTRNTMGEKGISDHIYSQMYNELYNVEVLPLKTEVKHLTQILNMLQADKKYLQEQNNALILGKHPLLTRLKMALLPSKNEE